jgi:hypothetical protein
LISLKDNIISLFYSSGSSQNRNDDDHVLKRDQAVDQIKTDKASLENRNITAEKVDSGATFKIGPVSTLGVVKSAFADLVGGTGEESIMILYSSGTP